MTSPGCPLCFPCLERDGFRLVTVFLHPVHMAKHSQHQQESTTSNRSGGGQAVVELCSITNCGLVFWSRQRFDIGAELQIRIRKDALPEHLLSGNDNADASPDDELVTVCGFVVECPAVRRHDGAHGFQVSLLLESALTQPPLKKRKNYMKYQHTSFTGLKRQGLN